MQYELKLRPSKCGLRGSLVVEAVSPGNARQIAADAAKVGKWQYWTKPYYSSCRKLS